MMGLVNVNTKLHIDLEWWEKEGKDFNYFLYQEMCPECKERIKDFNKAVYIDWIDPETAEVKRLNGLWETLITCCSQKPDYINPELPITKAIFRVFLANRNEPLSAAELAERYGDKIGVADPHRILRILTAGKVYNGIKPLKPSKPS